MIEFQNPFFMFLFQSSIKEMYKHTFMLIYVHHLFDDISM